MCRSSEQHGEQAEGRDGGLTGGDADGDVQGAADGDITGVRSREYPETY